MIPIFICQLVDTNSIFLSIAVISLGTFVIINFNVIDILPLRSELLSVVVNLLELKNLMGILQHLLTQRFSLVVLLDQFCLFLFAKTVNVKILPLICPILIVVIHHLISHKLFSVFQLFFGCCHCSVVCFNSFSRKFSIIGIVPFFFINFIFINILPLRSELFPVVVNLLELKNLMGILQHLLTQCFSVIVLLEQFCFFLFAKTVKVKILPLICPILIVVIHHLISHKL